MAVTLDMWCHLPSHSDIFSYTISEQTTTHSRKQQCVKTVETACCCHLRRVELRSRSETKYPALNVRQHRMVRCGLGMRPRSRFLLLPIPKLAIFLKC